VRNTTSGGDVELTGEAERKERENRGWFWNQQASPRRARRVQRPRLAHS
jgi:hypothetical protein